MEKTEGVVAGEAEWGALETDEARLQHTLALVESLLPDAALFPAEAPKNRDEFAEKFPARYLLMCDLLAAS